MTANDSRSTSSDNREPSDPRRLVLAGLALAASLSISSAATAVETYRKLSDAEIRSKLTGMEISEPHFSEQYMRDGAVRIVTMGRRIIGKWTVKSGQLCIEAPKPEDSRCKEVWRSGDKYQLRVQGDPVPYDVIIQKQQQRGW
ncbi:MAG TPA: hypothetical protein VIF39_06225 [Hyphomicrobium sp.]